MIFTQAILGAATQQRDQPDDKPHPRMRNLVTALDKIALVDEGPLARQSHPSA